MLDVKRVHQRIRDIAEYAKTYFELNAKGLSATKTDRRQMALLEKRLFLVLEPQERSDLLCDVATVASFFNVSIRQVQNWTKQKGLSKVRHGLYDLKGVFKWWLEVIGGSDDKEIIDVKLEYWRAKAERERLRVDQAKREVFPRGEVESEWTGRVVELRSGLLNWVDRLPAVLTGRNSLEMRKVLRDVVYHLLDTYSRKGQYCPNVEPVHAAFEPKS